jgi:phosphoenolpyruvate carboxykinase (GTP)
VLKWIVDRVHGRGGAVESPFGYMPRYQDLNWNGLKFDRGTYHAITDISREDGLREAEDQKSGLSKFGARLPREIEMQRELLAARLDKVPPVWRAPD